MGISETMNVEEVAEFVLTELSMQAESEMLEGVLSMPPAKGWGYNEVGTDRFTMLLTCQQRECHFLPASIFSVVRMFPFWRVFNNSKAHNWAI